MEHNNIDILEEGIVKDFGADVLELLLHEHAYDRLNKSVYGKCHIFWATDNYESAGFKYEDQIDIESITGKNEFLVRPRAAKSKEEQEKRTRDKAEVFTPAWICNTQNNLVDNAWFGQPNVFNVTNQDNTDWKPTKKVKFPTLTGKSWQDYVCDNRLEVACGEAPYLVSRYDTTTGKPIPIKQRIGILDRKLRVVCENVNSIEDWYLWAFAALKSTYGFEWQGDNLLLAREALLYSFIDYYEDFAKKHKIEPSKPSTSYLQNAANIISWNIFQMDGCKMVLPTSCNSRQSSSQSGLSNEAEETCEGCLNNNVHQHNGIKQVVAEWDKQTWHFDEKPIKTVEFHTLMNNMSADTTISDMNFNAIVGNPPYQLAGASGGNNDAPIYQIFSKISNDLTTDYASIILPARWFAAGRENLLGDYRKEMLNCGHIKQMVTHSNGRDIFPNVEIKGGICYYLFDKKYNGKCDYTLAQKGILTQGEVDLSRFDILIRNPKVAGIVAQVIDIASQTPTRYVDSIISNDTPFGIPSNPRTSTKTPFKVYTNKTDKHDVILYHIENQKRKIEYVAYDDIRKNRADVDKPKVFVPGTGGSGIDPYVLGRPECAVSHSVCSQSYLYAAFESDDEAKNFFKYLHTKFLRILVSAMKITQSAPQRVYRFVPMQNYTNQSDINWSKSIPEIDKQLYDKYKLKYDDIQYINNSLKDL